MSARWPIERHWTLLSSKGEVTTVTNDGLKDFRACGLLGSAGLGKSFEMASMASAAQTERRPIVFRRLAELGLSQERLESQLNRIADRATEDSLILLDALDEVMVPLRTAALTIERWVLESLNEKRPQVRISCRSAVWPHELSAAFREVYGDDSCAVAQLQPLSEEQIEIVANNNGLNGKEFLAQIEAVHANSLSQQPLTLEMLMKVFRGRGSLPQNREQLFREGTDILADERIERRRIGTNAQTPTPIIMEASERVACATLLSGRNTIDLDDTPADLTLGRRELEGLPGEPRLSFDVLQDIGRCGLCESDDPLRFRFAHRQFAEYLAGRRIAGLLPHQAKALLSSGLGWQAGVAGPLRETAAFAAMSSSAIAEWITDSDPELVGLSDVADNALRRRATKQMLDKFRKHELTDSQVGRTVTELNGFEYPGAESDLREVLRERQNGCEDVLEFAIELIESWKLTSLVDDLATLMLDSGAPIETRKAAGYALSRLGTPEVCKRLLPLIEGIPEDANYDLKGLALRCNWPANLSVKRLLEVLSPAPFDNYHGAYDGFLLDLEHDSFDASADLLAGLAWAKQFVGHDSHFTSGAKIARRIAVTALSRMSESGVTEGLADLLIAAESKHGSSPLALDRGDDESSSAEIHFAELTNERRQLLTAIVSKLSDKDSVWMVVHNTRGLVRGEDFRWLLKRATDETISMSQREHFAQLARMCPWDKPVEDFEAWLAVHEVEPIATLFRMPLFIELNSKEAVQARKAYSLSKRRERTPRRKKVRPSPADRVAQALVNCETKDSRFFANLCQELTLEEYSTHYAFERFLTRSPVWSAADESTKARIISVAKQYLIADLDHVASARTTPLSRILHGPMQAMWLLLECDRVFLESLPPTWWSKWAWYILRELHFNMMDELEEPKSLLLKLLHSKAADAIHAEVERLAQSIEERTTQLLSDILDALIDFDDVPLDATLCDLLSDAKVAADKISDVAQFVLARRHARSLSVCLNLVDPSAAGYGDQAVVEILDALLQQCIGESWSKVFEYLGSRLDVAREVLAKFAAGHRLKRATDGDSFLKQMTFAQVGQLVSLLIKAFPYEEDERRSQVSFLGQRDMAERLRDQLINWLGDQRDFGAVEALRKLESEHGGKYSWLKRPRAQAERNYRLSIWSPIPPLAVAEVLAANKKRLIRSQSDAADGIVSAIGSFDNSLRHESPNALDDLWELPAKGRAKPRAEERISEKLCAAVRAYFEQFAVTADREVQVFRRKQPVAELGAPGSEVDILCRVPSVGATANDPIAVPIEVKLAHNPEARTGLQDQLHDRYMSQIGSSVGVFVVVWMGNIAAPFRPLWKSVDEAKQELSNLAAALAASDARDVRVVVVDASLPTAKPKKKKAVRGKKVPTKQTSQDPSLMPSRPRIAKNKKAAKPMRKRARSKKPDKDSNKSVSKGNRNVSRLKKKKAPRMNRRK